MDGTADGATTAIAAVKPCAFGAPLRGFGAWPRRPGRGSGRGAVDAAVGLSRVSDGGAL